MSFAFALLPAGLLTFVIDLLGLFIYERKEPFVSAISLANIFPTSRSSRQTSIASGGFCHAEILFYVFELKFLFRMWLLYFVSCLGRSYLQFIRRFLPRFFLPLWFYFLP